MTTNVYISEKGKQALREYKYHGSDQSYLTPFWQPFWEWCVTLLPLWLAPNLVTFLGFLGILLQYFLTIFFTLTLDGTKVPSWVWFVNSLALFWYMTMDAIDGKQARRTQNSSALGELFDHGCDALSTMLQIVTIIVATQLGNSYWGLTVMITIHSTFFFAIWEQYYTGVLRLSALTGPTEALLTAITINLLTGIYGPSFWKIDIIELFQLQDRFQFQLPVNHLTCIWSVLMGIVTIYENFQYVSKAPLTPEQLSHKGSSFRAAVPFYVLLISWVIWMVLSPENLVKTQPVLGFSIFGFLTSYIVSRMVLSKTCQERCQPFYVILYPLIPITIHTLFSRFIYPSPIKEIYILIAYWIFGFVCYGHMVVNAINTICETLNIRCFRVKDVEKKN